MKGIIIGAGRGSRLKSMTDEQPKCYVPVGDRRIVDWTLEAFANAGLGKPVFIGGYLIDQIKRDYPQLTFVHNDNWPNNNILDSLFYAESFMEAGFVCSYSDILFRDTVVRRALDHPGDIVLCVDIHWRDRYAHRTEHPEDDAEKLTAKGDRVTRIHREIPSDEADGEYIGVAKFSAKGAAKLREHYHRTRKQFAGKIWRGGRPFEKAYLIMMIQEMIEQGEVVHMVTTAGDYIEIDTEQDYQLACAAWGGQAAGISQE